MGAGAASPFSATGRRERLTGWGLTAFLVALVLLPSASFAVFAGIPITSAQSYFGAMWLLVPLLLSGAVRRRLVRLVSWRGPRSLHAVFGLMAVALIAKLVLLIGAPAGGFGACFRSLAPLSHNGADAAALGLPARRCELSYANPLGRFDGATRLDRTIDFGDSVGGRDWGLDFFNSARFNYWAQWIGVPNRQYLPFAVSWSGKADGGRGQELIVRYVGQGAVSVDASTTALPPSYARLMLVRLRLPPGRHHLSVEYSYTHEVIQPHPLAEPYAGIVLTTEGGSPLQAAPVAFGWRLLAGAADLLIAILLALVVAAVVLATRGRILVAVLFGLAATVAIRLPRTDFLIGLLEFATFALVAWWVVRRRASLMTGLLTLYASVLTIELERARHELVPFSHVVLRSGGDDWLTYESQAHVVLAGSLRGGESVFGYVPSMRYILAFAHTLFGNGDGRVSVVELTGIIVALLSFVLVLVARARWDEVRARARILPVALVLLAALAGTLLVSSNIAVTITRDPLSEPISWALIPLACTLFLLVRRPWAFVTGAGLCAITLVTRVDYGIGLVALIGCGGVALLRERGPLRDALRQLRPAWATALAVFAAISLLPGAHNLYYGDKLRLVHDPGNGPTAFVVSVTDVPRLCCSSAVRSKFKNQVRLLLVKGQLNDNTFLVPLRLLQALWIGTLFLLVRRWKRLDWLTRLVGLLPLAFLLPQVFLSIATYYPRHVIADYVVMSISAMYVFADYFFSSRARP